MLSKTPGILTPTSNRSPLEQAWNWVEEIAEIDPDDMPHHIREHSLQVQASPHDAGTVVLMPGGVRIGNEDRLQDARDPGNDRKAAVQYLDESKSWKTLWVPHSLQEGLNVYIHTAAQPEQPQQAAA